MRSEDMPRIIFARPLRLPLPGSKETASLGDNSPRGVCPSKWLDALFLAW